MFQNFSPKKNDEIQFSDELNLICSSLMPATRKIDDGNGLQNQFAFGSLTINLEMFSAQNFGIVGTTKSTNEHQVNESCSTDNHLGSDMCFTDVAADEKQS